MATQKNSKSSRSAPSKSKSSKATPVKKSAPKAAVKGKQSSKTAPSKSKASVKTIAASKSKKIAQVAKKSASVAKKAAPVTKKHPQKPLSKAAPKKLAAAKPKVKPKVTPGIKAQKPQSRSAAPVKSTKAVVKATSKPTPPVKGKAGKPIGKTPVTATGSPVKKLLISKPVVAAKAKSIAQKHITPAALPQPKISKVPAKTITPSHPEVKTKTVESHQPGPKSVTEKPAATSPKSTGKPTGSKVSDLAKPTISSKPMVEKPKEEPKAKEFQRKSLKQGIVHTVKPFDTMSEKKENKSVGAMHNDEPHKTRYSDKELEEFDQLIDQKLIVAREQLEFYLKQLEDMAENPDNKIKGLDDGLSTLESERVSSMAARQQKLIQHLENAKIRIKNKVYGICRETGRLISKERLRAVPHATLSIEAKQAQN